jgi:fatty acid desaturase
MATVTERASAPIGETRPATGERPSDPRPTAIRQMRSQFKELGRLSPARSAFELALTWLQIVAIIAVYAAWPSWWAFCAAFLLVGARQYGLLILLHDASHTLVHPVRRVNDAIALWLIAAPCGSSYFNSRRLHLLHHQNLGKGVVDPDFFYYSSGPPFSKDTRRKFVLHFARLLLGQQIFHTLFNAGSESTQKVAAPLRKLIVSLLPVATMQLVLLVLFWAAGIWYGYFLLWMLPLVTLAVFFNGVRTFADHANPGPDVLEQKALIISYLSNPLERFFFAPYHMNFHAEHHYFPFIPHYNLPKARARLQETPEAHSSVQWRGSYVALMARHFRSLGR